MHLDAARALITLALTDLGPRALHIPALPGIRRNQGFPWLA